jgi:hypothetical protein
MMTRRFTKQPLQWLLGRLESFEDVLSVVGDLVGGVAIVVPVLSGILNTLPSVNR